VELYLRATTKMLQNVAQKRVLTTTPLFFNTFIMLIFYSGQFEIYNIKKIKNKNKNKNETGVLPATPLFQPYFLHCSYDLVYMLMQSHLWFYLLPIGYGPTMQVIALRLQSGS
jgi:hypothetical protein